MIQYIDRFVNCFGVFLHNDNIQPFKQTDRRRMDRLPASLAFDTPFTNVSGPFVQHLPPCYHGMHLTEFM
jgi:hypothetical protein